MYRMSEMPKVVGEFDAAKLHTRIDTFVEQNPDASLEQLNYGLGDDPATSIRVEQVANIQWNRLFWRGSFALNTGDGQANSVVLEGDRYRASIDEWHPDTRDAKKLVLPETLTGASKWPTEFLIGRVAVDPQLIAIDEFEDKFWRSEAGKEAIGLALLKGDAYLHKFKPGEIVKAPPGVIHRRCILSEVADYRYFLRLFPRLPILNSATSAEKFSAA